MSREEGFTLIELMTSVLIASLVVTAMGAFLLHHRALCRGLDVDSQHEQTARLVLDRLRRDARVSCRATVAVNELTLTSAEGQTTYRAGRDGLTRQVGKETELRSSRPSGALRDEAPELRSSRPGGALRDEAPELRSSRPGGALRDEAPELFGDVDRLSTAVEGRMLKVQIGLGRDLGPVQRRRQVQATLLLEKAP